MPTTYVPGNWVLAGATRGGKSLSHARVVVDAMEQRRLMSIVVIDPHARSLAWEVTKHGIARGHAARFIYDRLSDLKRAPGYSFLRVPQPERRTTATGRALRAR